MLRPLAVLFSLLLTTALLADPGVTIYSPDPAHPWNHLHATLFIRTAPDGRTFGTDTLDPLLWLNTKHLLDDEPSHREAIATLDDFLSKHSDALISDPVARAVLQRDLWAVFDWSAKHRWRESEWPPARELAQRLALVLRRLAPSAAAINSLPDNYTAAVNAHRFPVEFNPAAPDAPFLPPNLFDLNGPWICLGGSSDAVAPQHDDSFDCRSCFEIYFRHPAGREAGIQLLQKLKEYAQPPAPNPHGDNQVNAATPAERPQLVPGTVFALVRRMLLFDATGKIHASPIIESVQLRVYRSIPDKPALNGIDKAFFEFSLDRSVLLNDPSRSLRAVSPNEEDFLFVHFFSMGFDPFEDSHHGNKPRRYTVPVLANCFACHNSPGIASLNALAFRLPRSNDFFLTETKPSAEDNKIISRKISRYDWGLLEGLLIAPESPRSKGN